MLHPLLLSQKFMYLYIISNIWQFCFLLLFYSFSISSLYSIFFHILFHCLSLFGIFVLTIWLFNCIHWFLNSIVIPSVTSHYFFVRTLCMSYACLFLCISVIVFVMVKVKCSTVPPSDFNREQVTRPWRATDRHSMQSEVECLFSGIWTGSEKRNGRRGKRRGGRGKVGRREQGRSCLFKRETERKGLRLEAEVRSACLCSGWGEIGGPLQYLSFLYYYLRIFE